MHYSIFAHCHSLFIDGLPSGRLLSLKCIFYIDYLRMSTQYFDALMKTMTFAPFIDAFHVHLVWHASLTLFAMLMRKTRGLFRQHVYEQLLRSQILKLLNSIQVVSISLRYWDLSVLKLLVKC